MTHTVTHTADGNSGEDRAYFPQYTEWKALKSSSFVHRVVVCVVVTQKEVSQCMTT